jgi:hypothetical protein
MKDRQGTERLPALPRPDGDRSTPSTLAEPSGAAASICAGCPRRKRGIVLRRWKAAAGALGRTLADDFALTGSRHPP